MHHLEDEISSRSNDAGDSLRILDVPVPLDEATVNHTLVFKNPGLWDRVHDPPPSQLSLQALILSKAEA